MICDEVAVAVPSSPSLDAMLAGSSRLVLVTERREGCDEKLQTNNPVTWYPIRPLLGVVKGVRGIPPAYVRWVVCGTG